MTTANEITLLSDRTIVRFEGDEVLDFLQSLCSSDVTAVTQTALTPSALLTVQGKVVADFLLFTATATATTTARGVNSACLYLDCNHNCIEPLLAALLKYKLRRKVNFEIDEGISVISHMPCSAIQNSGGLITAPDPRHSELGLRSYTRLQPPLAPSQSDLTSWHSHRIGKLVAEVGQDFASGTEFAHELEFDRLGITNLTKGCYIGQEVVMRVSYRGKRNTKLFAAQFDDPRSAMQNDDHQIRSENKLIGRFGTIMNKRALAVIRTDRLEDHMQLRAAERNLTLG